jgi:hypothetical protein
LPAENHVTLAGGTATKKARNPREIPWVRRVSSGELT